MSDVMRFLGTGAGDGTPNPFCTCDICEKARRVGKREIRTCSSFMLSDKVIIDIGPNYFMQSYMYNVSFEKFEHALFTHMHDDHINYKMVWDRLVRNKGIKEPLNVYLVDEAYSFVTDFFLSSKLTEGSENYIGEKNVLFKNVNFHETFAVDGFSVTPYRAAHGTSFEKNGANFLIEKNGRKLYYGLDSGIFLPETYAALQNQMLDFFIGECTFPDPNQSAEECGPDHMNIAACLKNLDKLYDIGAIHKDTRILLSHIGPYCMGYEEFSEYVSKLDKPYRVEIAYDNMELGSL